MVSVEIVAGITAFLFVFVFFFFVQLSRHVALQDKGMEEFHEDLCRLANKLEQNEKKPTSHRTMFD